MYYSRLQPPTFISVARVCKQGLPSSHGADIEDSDTNAVLAPEGPGRISQEEDF